MMTYAPTRRLSRLLTATILGAAALFGSTGRGETVSGQVAVTVASGRTLVAEVDPRTDRQTLWLRWQRTGMLIQQPIAWERVVKVAVGGQSLVGDEFARSLDLDRQAQATTLPTTTEVLVLGRGTPEHGPGASAGPPAEPHPAVTTRPRSARVQSLAIDVQLAHWGSAAGTDGLMIDLSPVDAQGAMVPVHGTLEVELIGSERIRSRPGRAFPVIGRWVERVEPGSFSPWGARYRLAFQQVHPDADLSVEPFGVVHARLSVPGEGTFDASATIRIRPADPVRDRLQQASGSRFFPRERTAANR